MHGFRKDIKNNECQQQENILCDKLLDRIKWIEIPQERLRKTDATVVQYGKIGLQIEGMSRFRNGSAFSFALTPIVSVAIFCGKEGRYDWKNCKGNG